MTARPEKKTPKVDSDEVELAALLAAALKEPGVSEAIEFYERVEGVYQRALSVPQPTITTTNSANA